MNLFKTNGGKVAVLGSMHMFHDQYIDKEENGKIMVSPFQLIFYEEKMITYYLGCHF